MRKIFNLVEKLDKDPKKLAFFVFIIKSFIEILYFVSFIINFLRFTLEFFNQLIKAEVMKD